MNNHYFTFKIIYFNPAILNTNLPYTKHEEPKPLKWDKINLRELIKMPMVKSGLEMMAI